MGGALLQCNMIEMIGGASALCPADEPALDRGGNGAGEAVGPGEWPSLSIGHVPAESMLKRSDRAHMRLILALATVTCLE